MTDDNPSGDLPPKSMKGKYDGRRNNGSTKARRKKFPNLGPKPNWVKHLSRNDAAKTLEELDRIATAAEVYRAAWEKGNVGLCAEMRKQFQDRLLGRPFIAENPAKAGHDHEDMSRIAVAIKNLQIVQPAAERAALIKNGRRKVLVESATIEADAGDAGVSDIIKTVM